jgi:hypothetical protein
MEVEFGDPEGNLSEAPDIELGVRLEIRLGPAL